MNGRKIFSGLLSLCAIPMAAAVSSAINGNPTLGGTIYTLAELTQTAALYSAGAQKYTPVSAANGVMLRKFTEKPAVNSTAPLSELDEVIAETAEPSEPPTPENDSASVGAAQVISQNFSDFTDELDCTAEGNHSGAIVRRHYGKLYSGGNITLESGAQIQNCTELAADTLLAAADELPDITIHAGTNEPQVLIVHTHTTESYEPYQRDYYDADFPFRTRDCRRNMVAVGDKLARELARNGISVLHDGTEHDYPSYSGAYDRSEATIRAALEQYPSIKIVIDLHRDAISDADGSRIAPVTEINGKSAAQFMIIAGCDDGRFNMPNYMENFKLACLIQNTAQTLYPELARPILFDYRNYNQHITTGSLLIEIGSHGNSLDEALYTAELLGSSLSEALLRLSEQE
ncbi:MAG: stage II sporulation protein P [Oscillospiraceae bacterium]